MISSLHAFMLSGKAAAAVQCASNKVPVGIRFLSADGILIVIYSLCSRQRINFLRIRMQTRLKMDTGCVCVSESTDGWTSAAVTRTKLLLRWHMHSFACLLTTTTSVTVVCPLLLAVSCVRPSINAAISRRRHLTDASSCSLSLLLSHFSLSLFCARVSM